MYPVLVSCAAALVGFYLGVYYWNKRRLQQKATFLLRRLEEALGGRGHVISFRWLGSAECEAALRFACSNFRRASVRMEFSKLPLPSLPWIQPVRESSERLVFTADLESAPRFKLNVRKQRWTAQSGKIRCHDPAQWNYESVVPVIFTTAADWTPELAATVITSRANQQQDFQDVQFRKCSPHFSASLPLHVFSDGDNHLQFFSALRDLAAEASTSTK